MAKAYLSVNDGDKSRRAPGPDSKGAQWQVLHDLVEQLVQLDEEALIRLEPPPMPNDEINFCGPSAPQSGQTTSLSRPP